MGNIVTIKPKPGSRRFKAMQGMHNVHRVSEDSGKTHVEKSMGEYKGERFPKSRQMHRPIYSLGRRRWLLKGFDPANPEDVEKLNKLVKACKFQYPKKHKKEGDYIVEADMYDSNDAFFNHKSCRLLAKEGEIILDKDRPLDKILDAALKENKLFQVGNEHTASSNRVKYVIIDREIDTKNKKEKRDKKLKTYSLYQSLTDKKKAKLATILELVPYEGAERDLIDDVLLKFAEDDKTKAVGENISKQDLFVKLCEMDTEDLALDYQVAKAKSLGFLKKNKNGFILFGNPVGKTKEEVKQYLLNEEHQELLIRLEQAINDKSH